MDRDPQSLQATGVTPLSNSQTGEKVGHACEKPHLLGVKRVLQATLNVNRESTALNGKG